MAARRLRIADGLTLPLDVVTQPIAILARRGAGKTYTAAVLVEEVVRANVPVVVLDPTGGWWGLRSSVDGKSPGLPVVIFGGDHADVRLERSAGRVIADVVLEHPGAYVIDLSGFESKAAEQAFARDFLERLYRGKKRETGPLLLVVDEADVFAPQRPGPDQTHTLGALESIVRRGRIKGLGDLLISQRAAVLNKNVLTQTEVLVAMQTTGPQDRAAIDDWIAGNGTREERDEVLGSLASLERGEAWIWSPAFLRILQRVRIRERTTFDSSRTPGAGEQAVRPVAFAKVDLAALGERIRSTVEQAKANDPAELQRRIRELERLASTSQAPTVERVEVPVLNGQVPELRAAIAELVDAGQRLVEVAVAVRDAATVIQSVGSGIEAAIGRVTATPNRGQVERAPRGVPRSSTQVDRLGSGRGDSAVATLAPAAPSRTPAPSEIEGGGVRFKAGARRMLSALARLHPTPLTLEQVGVLAGVQRGGTFSDYLRSIVGSGLAETEGRTVRLTGAGVEQLAAELGSGAPSTEELVAMYAPKLKLGARRMLDLLIARYPDGMTRIELSEAAEIARGGTFSDYLRSLTRVGLAIARGDLIYAGDDLFMAGRL